MKSSFRSRLSSFIFHPAFFLFILALLTYAIFFWERGFYWDEAPWTWIYYRLGPAALTKTFSTSRPFWGMIYQVMLPLVGPRPWVWQLLMVVLRWLTAIQVWLLFRRLWPKSHLPLWASALFLVYPGLGQNYIALMYTHFYIVFNAFLLSLYLSVLAVQKKSWPLHTFAITLSIVNLLTLEHFYFLEAFRAILFWILIEKPKIKRVAILYSPYVVAILGVTFWRAFFFTNQNASYTYQTLVDLKSNFLWGIGKLLLNMLKAFWETVPHAWFFPFESVDISTLGLYTAIGAFGLAFASTLLVGLYLYSRNAHSDLQAPSSKLQIPTSYLQPLLLGLAAWILGGGAFWLVGERTLPQLHFSADRFTLAFMLGSSLIVAALLGFLDKHPRVQITLLALLIGFSVGKQFQTNATYRRDWDTQRAFFWQMSWRIPSLEPGTTIISNDLPVTVFSDNSLSGPLNWIYSPYGKMDTMLYFASVRTQEGRALGTKLEPGVSFDQNYLATTFHGHTSQMIVVNFAPPGCFRVLDPEIDPLNKLIPPELRDAAFLSNPAMIRSDNPVSLPAFENPEIHHGWCFYFSKAELARQNGDWQQVVKFHQQAQAIGDRPNDPVENFVFIEAYAHTAQWDQARKLTKDAFKFSKEVMRPVLCTLWQRIERSAASTPEKNLAVKGVNADLGCSFGAN
jgi:hypothetical protein